MRGASKATREGKRNSTHLGSPGRAKPVVEAMKLLRSALALASLSAAYGIEPTPILLDLNGGEKRYALTNHAAMILLLLLYSSRKAVAISANCTVLGCWYCFIWAFSKCTGLNSLCNREENSRVGCGTHAAVVRREPTGTPPACLR